MAFPVLALGGAGGLRIPNTIYDVLINLRHRWRLDGRRHRRASPPLHRNARRWLRWKMVKPANRRLSKLGFPLREYRTAYATAVSFNLRAGDCASAAR